MKIYKGYFMKSILKTLRIEADIILKVDKFKEDRNIKTFNEAFNIYIFELLKRDEEKSKLADMYELQQDTRKSITIIATILQNKLRQ